jgi:hypothetical protein
VGAVAVAVVAAVVVLWCARVDAHGCSPAEVVVGRADAGVDDVGVDGRAGRSVGIGVVQREIALIDAIKPIGHGGLGRDGAHDAVLFDGLDGRIL